MDKELPVSAWPEWMIVEKIGEGSFGQVYKAQRTERGKSFTLPSKLLTFRVARVNGTVCVPRLGMTRQPESTSRIWLRNASRKSVLWSISEEIRTLFL